MPKTISTPEELELHYPAILTEGSSQASKDMALTKQDEFKLADIDAINKVRKSLLYFMIGNRNANL